MSVPIGLSAVFSLLFRVERCAQAETTVCSVHERTPEAFPKGSTSPPRSEAADFSFKCSVIYWE